MNKSVYSIVLADEVVAEIDRLAYSMNTSRSNLINQILAERVELMTPEMRMKIIFDEISQLIDSQVMMLEQASESMISIKSPVRYKYNPIVRYVIELGGKNDNYSAANKVGRLKAYFRTKSEQLITAADAFFDLWAGIEEKYLSNLYARVPSERGGGRYERRFYSNGGKTLEDGQIANAITGYILLMDSCIQMYFKGLTRGTVSRAEIETAYSEYLKKGVDII